MKRRIAAILMGITASLALDACKDSNTTPAPIPASAPTYTPASAPAYTPTYIPASAPVSAASAPAAVPASAPAATVVVDANEVTRLPFDGAAPLPGALSISADGHTAAHIGTNGDVVLWDAAKVKPRETIPAAGKKPSAVALSPGGDLVAIGYFDSRVIIWSRRERKAWRELHGHTGGISALAFSSDGKLLASGGDDATAQIWDLSSGKRLRIFDSQFGGSDHGGLVVSLGFSGNGRVLIVNEWYSRFYDVGRGTTLWDIDEGIEISTRGVAPPNSDNVMRTGQALGGNGWLLAYTGYEGLMVDRLDGCESPRQMPSGHYADTVAADQQGRWVAASEGEQLTFFGTSGNTKGYPITLPARAISLVAHPDGRSIFALMIAETHPNGNENFIIGRDAETVTGSALYRIRVPKPLWRLPPMVVKENATHCAPTEAVRMKQDFKLPEKALELTVIAKLAPTKEMQATIDPPRELYFSPKGLVYALYHHGPYLSDLKSGVAVWDVQTRRPLRTHFEAYIENTFRVKEGWGGSRCSEIRNNLLTGKTINPSMSEKELGCSTIISDRDTGDTYRVAEGRLEHYAPDGKRLQDIKIKEPVHAVAARNGKIAALYASGDVQVWEIQPVGKSEIFKSVLNLGEGYGIDDSALSSDGRYLQLTISGSGDAPTEYPIYSLSLSKQVAEGPLLAPFPGRANLGVVQDTRPHHLAVWDFDKKEIIAHLPRHSSRDKSGAYKPLLTAISDDGRLLASASYDGRVRVWDIKARQVIGEASLGGEVTAMAFDTTSRQLAAGRVDGQIFVLQLPN